MKKFFIIFLVIFLIIIACERKLPNKSFELIEKFLKFRNENNYIQMYKLYYHRYYKSVPFESFKYREDIYAKRFGKLIKYELIRWSYRKNFACGPGSGKMVAVIVHCIYTGGETEETFTLLNVANNEWKIFDYYLKPIVIKKFDN